MMIPGRVRVLAFASGVGLCQRPMNANGSPRGLVGRRNRGRPLEGLGFLLAGHPPLEFLGSVLCTYEFTSFFFFLKK